MPVDTLDFGEKWGKWKVRGLLAEEDFQAQDDYLQIDMTTGKQKMDTVGMRIQVIQLGIIDSPEGPHPPTNYLRRMPSGIANKLLEKIKALGTPGGVVTKN